MGANSYRLTASGDLARIGQLPAVAHVVARPDGDGANGGGDPTAAATSIKLMLHPGASGAEVLRQLVQFLEVQEFRSEEPDLEEIFIKAVHDAA